MNPDEPKPEVRALAPKAEATGLTPDPKAVALTQPSKAAEPMPEAKVELKTAVKPEAQPEAKSEAKPAAKTGGKVEPKADETKHEAKPAAAKTTVGNKIIFTIAVLGIFAGLVAAYIFGMERKPQPPVFKPVSNPYDSAIYANGMIESDLPSGENINIFPEVSGPIVKVLVQEGQPVKSGTLLFTIEDSVQRANTELAAANLKLGRDQYDKDRAAYAADPRAISKNALDTAEDTVNQAAAALKAASLLFGQSAG
jgi:hypothetical protein